jgi:hypothetical protein
MPTSWKKVPEIAGFRDSARTITVEGSTGARPDYTHAQPTNRAAGRQPEPAEEIEFEAEVARRSIADLILVGISLNSLTSH